MSAAASYPLMPRLLPPDPDDRERYEILDGVKVGMPPMSADSSGVASDLTLALSTYGISHNIGKAYSEMLTKLPIRKDHSRRPDVIFVPFARWPKGKPLPPTAAWAVLPDLCVEVVSPTDYADEVMNKVVEYFAAGVRQVWVVYPRHGLLYVHDSPSQVRGLTRSDELDGGEALPGFKLPLADLFPDPETPAPPG